MTTTTFYLITAYTPTFGSLHLDQQESLLITLCIGVSNFLWLPIGGWVSARIGRRPVLLSIPALALLTAYPAMLWLVGDPDFTKLLLVLLWFSFLFGIYNGAKVPSLTEIMPSEVRTTAFSLAYS